MKKRFLQRYCGLTLKEFVTNLRKAKIEFTIKKMLPNRLHFRETRLFVNMGLDALVKKANVLPPNNSYFMNNEEKCIEMTTRYNEIALREDEKTSKLEKRADCIFLNNTYQIRLGIDKGKHPSFPPMERIKIYSLEDELF